MANQSRANYLGRGAADSAAATIASGENPDGTAWGGIPISSVPAVAAVTEVGFSVTADAGGETLPSQACHKVSIQNRMTADDGSTVQDKNVWVIIGGVKVYELVNGQSVDVFVTNANLVSVMSFSGTSLVSGTITP